MRIITGFHRSGTSCIAGALFKTKAVQMGPQEGMIGPHPSNEKGHFENLDIVNLNDAILRANFSSWREKMRPKIDQIPANFATIVNEIYTKYGIDFTVKDPRFCVTLGVWKSVFTAFVTKAVVVLRPPAECVMSLNRRNGIEPEEGFSMWKWYTTDLVKNLSSEASGKDTSIPALWVNYSDFLEKPKAGLLRILSFLGHSQINPASLEAACAMPEARLRHETGKEIETPAEIKNLYDEVLCLTKPKI